MPKCLVCERERSKEDCKIIVLTEEEQAQVENPLPEYVYCKPCWKVLSDPVAGPALMSGIAQHQLQNAGVSNARKVASEFRTKLMSLALRKK